MDKKFLSTFFKGIVSTSFGTILKIGFHFLSVMMLARFVPKDELGAYFLAVLVVNILLKISSLGLDLTLVKFITGKERSIQSETFITASLIRLVVVVILALAFQFAGKFVLPIFGEGLAEYVGYMNVIFIVTMFKDWFLRLLQGIHKFKAYATAEIVSAISRVVLLLVLQNKLTVPMMLFIEVLVVFPSIFVELYVLRDFLSQLSISVATKEKIQELTRFGFPLYLNNILNLFITKGSTLLIGGLLTAESVAAYEIAAKIPDGFMMLFSSFILVYYPSQSTLFSDGDHAEAEKFMNNTLILLSTGIALVVLISFLFGDVIVLIFTSEYSEVALTFSLLMLSFSQRAISNVLGYSIVSAGKSSAPVITNVIAASVNFISSLILIRQFGYIGAAYSVILMDITSQIVYLVYLKHLNIGTDIMGYIKPFLFMGLFVAGYLIFVDGTNWLVGILLVVLFAAICWVTIEPVRNFILSALNQLSERVNHAKA